ncbi:MAG: hypothetical protein IK052_04330 [Bacteroidales bacterium]|nr:hypothetical protein [Bacteroidales bacterium]
MARKKHRRSRLSQIERQPKEVCKDTIGVDIPKGDSPEDIRARKKIIDNFYAKWNAANPDKKVWNSSLNDFIYVKYQSINETKGHAALTYMSTRAVFKLTETLKNATVLKRKEAKANDKNQKSYDQMIIMTYPGIRLLVGHQTSKNQYVQYCITAKKEKK